MICSWVTRGDGPVAVGEEAIFQAVAGIGCLMNYSNQNLEHHVT